MSLVRLIIIAGTIAIITTIAGTTTTDRENATWSIRV
jgi:hypothetical protein